VALASATFFGAQRLRDIDRCLSEFAPAEWGSRLSASGLSPAEVEAQVTVPIENAMNGVPA